MKKQKWLYIVGGAVALVLVCVLLVGLLNGVWPWQSGSYFGNYKGTGASDETQGTDQTEQTTEATQENTDATVPGNGEGSGGTAGSGSTDSDSTATEGSNNTVVEDTDIKIPLGTDEEPANTGSDTSDGTGTENSEETKETGSSSGEVPGNEISFDDLLDRAGD